MSLQLAYFPERGSRFAWTAKSLTYDPWTCDVSGQLSGGQDTWPMRVLAYVDLIEGRYVWRVKVEDWTHGRRYVEGTGRNALAAMKAAERAAERAYRELSPAWVKKALTEGWRPPTRAT